MKTATDKYFRYGVTYQIKRTYVFVMKCLTHESEVFRQSLKLFNILQCRFRYTVQIYIVDMALLK